MSFPTVTEIRIALEPCTADTFIADLDPRRVGESSPVPASAVTSPERALEVFHPYAYAG